MISPLWTTSSRTQSVQDAKNWNQQGARDGSQLTEFNEVTSPIVFAPRNHLKLRLCVHYKRKYTGALHISYSTPQMDKCPDSLGGVTISSTLDAHSDHCQIEIGKDDRAKTAFASHYGSIQFTYIQFGLKKRIGHISAGTWRHLISVHWQHVIVSLEDIVKVSKSQEAHDRPVRYLPTLLCDNGDTIKLQKGGFFSKHSPLLWSHHLLWTTRNFTAHDWPDS